MKKYLNQPIFFAITLVAQQLSATVTIENNSAVPIRITQVTLWQSQGLEELPIPHKKDIVVAPGHEVTHSMLTDGQAVPVIEVTLNINNVPYQFTLAHDDQRHNTIRISPELKIELDGQIQRMRPSSRMRYALPAGIYAV